MVADHQGGWHHGALAEFALGECLRLPAGRPVVGVARQNGTRLVFARTIDRKAGEAE